MLLVVVVCGRHGLWPSWFVAIMVCGHHCRTSVKSMKFVFHLSGNPVDMLHNGRDLCSDFVTDLLCPQHDAKDVQLILLSLSA